MGPFLVGVRGCLFEVGEAYQVGELAAGYSAVGCGAEIALGALHATGNTACLRSPCRCRA
jgi:hypothetical protein